MMVASKIKIDPLVAAFIFFGFIVCHIDGAPATVAVPSPEQKGSKTTSAFAEYQKLKSGLRERKREMCSFLLNDLDNREDEDLDLRKVTRLFEASLEHLAKTTSYVTLMKPYVKEEIMKNFDKNGSAYVLNISDTRRKLIEDYKSAEANGASDEVKRDVLESYFYKACESKLSTIVTEKSMYDSAIKAEKLLHVKLLNTDGEH